MAIIKPLVLGSKLWQQHQDPPGYTEPNQYLGGLVVAAMDPKMQYVLWRCVLLTHQSPTRVSPELPKQLQFIEFIKQYMQDAHEHFGQLYIYLTEITLLSLLIYCVNLCIYYPLCIQHQHIVFFIIIILTSSLCRGLK